MAAHGVVLPRRRANNSPQSSNDQGTGPAGAGSRVLQPPPGVDPTKYSSALNACRSQIFAGAGAAGAGRSGPPGTAAGHIVVYKLTGDARTADVVYVDSGGANDAQPSLPYQTTVTLASGAPFAVVAQGMNGSTITCQVLIDGKSITTNAATTPGLAECNGTVP
jgi:hypothetical protein